MENIPPFYVGQKVVRIGDSTHQVKKGAIYTIADCFKCPKCESWKVLILEFPYYGNEKFTCGYCSTNIKCTKYYGGTAKNFAPVHENFQSISLTKVLEEETKLTGVN